jgi:hypothetical protein
VNTTAAISASCSVPGRFYSALFGGLLGVRIFHSIVGILLLIPFYIGTLFISVPLGKFLLRRLTAEIISQTG